MLYITEFYRVYCNWSKSYNVRLDKTLGGELYKFQKVIFFEWRKSRIKRIFLSKGGDILEARAAIDTT